MRIRWTRGALRSLDEIAEFIARDKPGAARRTVERIRKAVEVLPDHPELGRSGRIPETREFIVPGTPFIVPYRVRGVEVEILAVFHAPAGGRIASDDIHETGCGEQQP